MLARNSNWAKGLQPAVDVDSIFEKLATDFANVPVYRRELANTHNSLGAVLVQGNVHQDSKWNLDTAKAAFERHLALTRDAMSHVTGPAVVIWPETSSTPYWLQTDPGARAAILPVVSETAGLPKSRVRFNPLIRRQKRTFAALPYRCFATAVEDARTAESAL